MLVIGPGTPAKSGFGLSQLNLHTTQTVKGKIKERISFYQLKYSNVERIHVCSDITVHCSPRNVQISCNDSFTTFPPDLANK